MNFYAIYDLKAGYYLTPFIAHNHHVAKRMFTASCSDSNTSLYQFPTDYELFLIGSFDEQTAEIATVEKESLGLAAAFRRLDFYPPQPVPTTFDGSTEE